MDGQGIDEKPSLSPRAKLFVVAVVCLLAVLFVAQIRPIIYPFMWAVLVAYLLNPVVNYLNVEGRLPRIWSVALLYIGLGLLLFGGSRYLYPQIVDQGSLFVEDIPRLEASLISRVGPQPMGIDIAGMIGQLLSSVGAATSNTRNASHLIINAFETVLQAFLFLVTTFYLLMDAPRVKSALVQVLPPAYREEIGMVATQINATWKQYIRGELVLFVIMATATTIGLTILQVPGAIFLGLASGALELLPLVGPITAGALAVLVAYLNETNPWGWSQAAYALSVAVLYFALRQTEDYFVIPHVLGRAVRLHPLVVLLAVASGGLIGGLFGLIVAVPTAASIRTILSYLYAKLLDLPFRLEAVPTVGGGIIEIPVHGPPASDEDSITDGTGTA